MAMGYSNIIKGAITQTLAMTLFERLGYRVTRLGVEELFSEIKHLDQGDYLGLGLPVALRYLPDLLIADPQLNRAHLLEVKFRKRWSAQAAADLHARLKRQRKHWPDSVAMILRGEPARPGDRFHQDYIRLVGAGDDGLKKLLPGLHERDIEDRWNGLPWLSDLVPGLQHDGFRDADYLTRLIRELRHL